MLLLAGCAAASSKEEEAAAPEETTSVASEKTTEEGTVEEEETTVGEVVEVPAPAPETPLAPAEQPTSSEPSLTPEQIESRRIYDERMESYDGTGPSPWVQGQIDWAAEHQAGSQSATPGPFSTEKEAEAYWEASGRPGGSTPAEHAAQS